jgi:equilibrative nucleoside transporter 1/2/3
MDRIRRLFAGPPAYEPLEDDEVDTGVDRRDALMTQDREQLSKNKFSWTEYSVFLVLGVAMLWAWYAAHTQQCPLLEDELTW